MNETVDELIKKVSYELFKNYDPKTYVKYLISEKKDLEEGINILYNNINKLKKDRKLKKKIKYEIAEYYALWGDLLIELEKYDEAINKFNEITKKIDNNFFLAYYNWGYCLGEIGKLKDKLDDKIEYYEKPSYVVVGTN